MSTYSVYELIHPVTKICFYVGWTSRATNKRLYEHINEKKIINISKTKMINEILATGLTPLISVVVTTTNKEESIKKELELIAFYGRINDGGILTNMSKGGEHHIVSTETKKKLSAARIGKSYEDLYGKEVADKLKINLSIRNKGKGNPMYGKTQSSSSIEQGASKRRGKIMHPISDYQKDQIKKSNSSRIWTTEMKLQMSISQKQRKINNPDSFKKGPFSLEHKKNISIARLTRVEKTYNFVHDEHGNFTGTIQDLIKHYPDTFTKKYHNAEIWKLTAGLYKSCKGWKLL